MWLFIVKTKSLSQGECFFLSGSDDLDDDVMKKDADRDDTESMQQGQDLLEAAAKAEAEAAAEQQQRRRDLQRSGGFGAPAAASSSAASGGLQVPDGDAPTSPGLRRPLPVLPSTSDLTSSRSTSDFFGKNPDDDPADENADDGDDYNDPDDEGMDIDDPDADLEAKLAATVDLPLPLGQMSAMTAKLPDSNVKLERLQSTRVAVAQFAENNMPNLVGNPPTDMASLRSAICTLQQQQMIQLQILQQLQQQLMAGMAPSMSNLQAMMQATQSLLPNIAAVAKLTPEIANTAPGSNLSPPSSTAAAPPQGSAVARPKSPGAATLTLDRKPLSPDDDDTGNDPYSFSHKQADSGGSPMSHLTKMVEVGKLSLLLQFISFTPQREMWWEWAHCV